MKSILLIGFGNPGRLDDGLGPALAKAIEDRAIPGVTVDADYQLTVDDAADAAKHDVVIFADAAVAGVAPFWIKQVYPSLVGKVDFTSHSCSPVGVLTLAKQLFQAEPIGFVLGIRGYEFNEFNERLSEKATANLGEAIEHLAEALTNGTVGEVRPEGAPDPEADQN
jgi:hydrogenase maturation protease